MRLKSSRTTCGVICKNLASAFAEVNKRKRNRESAEFKCVSDKTLRENLCVGFSAHDDERGLISVLTQDHSKGCSEIFQITEVYSHHNSCAIIFRSFRKENRTIAETLCRSHTADQATSFFLLSYLHSNST